MTDNAAARLEAQLNQVIYGKPELIRMVVAAFIAGGHVLLEGLPGLGKTVLARSMATLTGLTHKRIQFTPDLMPADITGSHIIDETQEGSPFRFIPGPIFTNFLLADEINRASPKTQAALLEAMAERTVTQLGVSRKLEAPFFVLATQNPIEMEGVNPLPEAQLDRFALKLHVPPASEDDLLRVIETRTQGASSEPSPLLSGAEVLQLQARAEQVYLPQAVARLISRLVARLAPTHPHAAPALRDQVSFGPSPRAAIWLAKVSRALAFLDEREGVGFEDVQLAAPHVLGHRLILSYGARLEGTRAEDLIAQAYTTSEAELIGAEQASA